MKVWKYKIIEYEYISLTSKEKKLSKTCHYTNSYLLKNLISFCLKMNHIKYDVIINY